MITPPDPRMSTMIILGIIFLGAVPPVGVILLTWAFVLRRRQVAAVKHYLALAEGRRQLAADREFIIAAKSFKL